MLSLWQDVRYSLRVLRKNRGFAAVIISCALGIGANITIFSLVNSLLLRPLPGVTDADRLVAVYGSRQGRGYYEMSYLTFSITAIRTRSLPIWLPAPYMRWPLVTATMKHDRLAEWWPPATILTCLSETACRSFLSSRRGQDF